ncbi:MAG: AMP-binding protein, partial [Desulfobacterales bacterium]
FLEIFFACAKTGAIMVPVNAHLALPELEYAIGDCAPRLLVYAAETADKVRRLRQTPSEGMHCLVQGSSAAAADSALADLVEGQPPDEPAPDGAVDLGDPLLIMYTSGTTGAPKGAVLTHKNFLYGAINAQHSYHLDAACKSLVVAPLFHIAALAASVTPVVYAGGALVLKNFDNPSDIIDCIMREKITFMFGVPVMYEMMAKSPRWPSANFADIDFFMAGGAPMPVSLIRRYQAEKGVAFAQGYGMTETLRMTSLELTDASRKAGSIGKAVLHARLKILDDDGREVAPGEIGQIVFSGPTVFAGYWNKPRATEAVLQHGWFHTGDLGRCDDEGFLYLVGRKNELIICAGKNIYAAEVERAIEQHPQVAEAAVVGLPDPKRGEIVAAFIRLEDDRSLAEGELLHFLEDKIAAFKCPRKVAFVRHFPRNKTGKIQKDKLGLSRECPVLPS